uniref:Ion transport domain-containing protein n=1 Tax=Magallana gigas TaxID=29159 RepID=A0A8W8NFI1_MAGGI
MRDIPDRLNSYSRFLPVNFCSEKAFGKDTVDDDFKQLETLREVKEEKEKEKRKRAEITLSESMKAKLRENTYTDSNLTPITASRSKNFEELRQMLFNSVLKDDDTATHANILKIIGMNSLSDAVMTNPTTNENVLNYALSNNLLKKANLLIEMSDETLLQHAFSVGSTTKTALLQVTEFNAIDLAKNILNRLKDVKKAMTTTTKIEISDQRPRDLTCLHLAAYYGFTDLIRLYLKFGEPYGISVDFLNEKKDTALLWATKCGHEDMECLLSLGADPNKGNDKGSTAFYWAIRYGHTDIVRLLLKNTQTKVDINKERGSGLRAPIVLASAIGNYKIVELLLQHGADPNHVIRGGQTPLHHACKEGRTDVVRILLESNADFKAKDAKGDTALLLAGQSGHTDIVSILLDRGDDPTQRNNLTHDLWYYAMNNSDLLNTLIENGAAPSEGKPHFFTAARYGHIEMIEHLLKAKQDPQELDSNRNTFLHHATLFNQSGVIRAFHKIVSVDAKNDRGETCLHISVNAGFVQCTQTLLEVNASTNIPNKRGENILHIAAMSKHTTPEIAKMIVVHTIKTHDWESLKATDSFGNNALHIAAKFAVPEVLWKFRLLSFKDLDNDGNTPLHKGVRSGEDSEGLETMLEIFEMMNCDGNVNQPNNKKETVLHLAALEGYHNTIKRLIYLKADLEAKDSEGNTVLHKLVMKMASDPNNSSRYLRSFDVIAEQSTLWWSNKQNLKLYDLGKTLTDRLHRQAMVYLMTTLKNNMDLSPLTLACELGVFEVLSRYLMMKNVTFFKEEDNVLMDVTNIMPMSSEDLSAKYFTGIEISKEFRHNPINITTSSSLYVFAYIVVPMEPLIFLLYFIMSVRSLKKRRDFTNLVLQFLPFLFHLSFSGLVIAWLVLITIQERYQDYVLAICLCFGWTYTITFTRGFKAINCFWRMILNMIVSDIRRFFVVYICVLLAFAFTLHALFQISYSIAETYPTMADTIFLVFNIMMGMGELFDDNFELGMSTAGRTAWFAKVVYVIYQILATIVLLNMLIAMMNDSYKKTLDAQKYHWRVDSVQIGVRIEQLLPWLPKMFSKIQHRKIPGEDENYKVQKYFLILKQTEFESKYSQMAEPIEPIDVQIKDQTKDNLVERNSRMTDTEQQLKTIGNKLDQLVSLVQKGQNTYPSSTTTPVEDFSKL